MTLLGYTIICESSLFVWTFEKIQMHKSRIPFGRSKKYQGLKKAKFIYNRMDKRVTTIIVSVRNDFPN